MEMYRTADMTGDDGRPVGSCTVMLWDHFIHNPGLLHRAFEKGYRQGENYTEVLDLTRGLENERLAMFEVFNTDEFTRISQELQTKCLLFRTFIKHDRVCKTFSTGSKQHYSTERWTDELAVLINTEHPDIHDDLVSKLGQARSDIENGKKFCLRLDFTEGVKRWYGEVCEDSRISIYPKSYDTNTVKNLSVFVLNCSKPISFFMSKCAMICCFPCWLLSGGCCYYINRKKNVDDIVEKFGYRVTFEGRGAQEQEDTPFCGCGKIYHLPVLNLQVGYGRPAVPEGYYVDY